MVKGIQRQVILVPSPDPELFDQAIFILKDSAVKKGVTEQMLLKQARQAIRKEKRFPWAVLWTGLGACLMGTAWALSLLL